MVMHKRKGFSRAARAIRGKAALFQRRRGPKSAARGRGNQRGKRAADNRLVDAFGGIDIAAGHSWFGPLGRQ